MADITWITIGLSLIFTGFLGVLAILYNKTHHNLVEAAKLDPATTFSSFGRTINFFVSAGVAGFVAAIVLVLAFPKIMPSEAAAPILAGIIGYVAGAAQTHFTSRPN